MSDKLFRIVDVFSHNHISHKYHFWYSISHLIDKYRFSKEEPSQYFVVSFQLICCGVGDML
jgi:hypothetical protein